MRPAQLVLNTILHNVFTTLYIKAAILNNN
jgi:hypothetical protein